MLLPLVEHNVAVAGAQRKSLMTAQNVTLDSMFGALPSFTRNSEAQSD